jgi:hypothetical protein
MYLFMYEYLLNSPKANFEVLIVTVGSNNNGNTFVIWNISMYMNLK